ncbi:hypothetical protein BD311DRAFT_671458 [Dichomitus squalens]|uniref:Uncharacterized protein n=1 Tax=Dichomitus squalens TaxID=114155 RepID=A0A4Q9MBQ8_9APHY|nr:hypothetical protein BD311DRAFT_671458 [Dichomitus squalens]
MIPLELRPEFADVPLEAASPNLSTDHLDLRPRASAEGLFGKELELRVTGIMSRGSTSEDFCTS